MNGAKIRLISLILAIFGYENQGLTHDENELV